MLRLAAIMKVKSTLSKHSRKSVRTLFQNTAAWKINQARAQMMKARKTLRQVASQALDYATGSSGSMTERKVCGKRYRMANIIIRQLDALVDLAWELPGVTWSMTPMNGKLRRRSKRVMSLGEWKVSTPLKKGDVVKMKGKRFQLA